MPGAVTLADGKATLNSIPGVSEPDGSVNLTLTLTKGEVSDTLNYTYAVSGKPENPIKPAGRITAPLITMASDQVNTEPGDRWILDILTATLKDTLSSSDLAISGLPAGMGYTAAKVGDNYIEITLNGPAAAPVTTTANIEIIVKASAIIEAGAFDSDVFKTTIAPFAEEVVIDYKPGPMGFSLLRFLG